MSLKKIYLISLLLISSFATGGFAMGFFDAGRVCLFSGISGTITLEGKPVANARVIRTADKDGPKTDETVTDENGYFSLPPMYERTVTKFLPMEFVVGQNVRVIDDEGNSIRIWSSVKRHKDENSELKGKPIVVSCDIEGEETTVLVNGVSIISRCSFDVEPDEKIDWNKSGLEE